MPAPHPKEPQMPAKPTNRQLTYLRSLADRTGQTFTYPHTARQASAEIERLKHPRPSSGTEVRIERKLIADQIAAGPADSSRVLEHEIAGHGSGATWVQNRPQEPTVPEDGGPSNRRHEPKVGKRTELAGYTVPTGERVIYGQRVDGVVRVTDRPAGTVQTGDRAYLVERGLELKGELDALIADYLATAEKLAAVPMSGVAHSHLLH
jgi:hypothetical protein